MTTRAQIVAYARETLGTPYAHQQRINGLAIDCAGVIIYVGRRMGLNFEEITGYSRLPKPDEMRGALDANLVRIDKNLVKPGDVIWMRIKDLPQHLGIVGDYHAGGNSMIHAYNSGGIRKVVEHALDATWKSRIVAAWSYPGVEE
jgi:cell wall-associated NlpC family hydrolase